MNSKGAPSGVAPNSLQKRRLLKFGLAPVDQGFRPCALCGRGRNGIQFIAYSAPLRTADPILSLGVGLATRQSALRHRSPRLWCTADIVKRLGLWSMVNCQSSHVSLCIGCQDHHSWACAALLRYEPRKRATYASSLVLHVVRVVPNCG